METLVVTTDWNSDRTRTLEKLYRNGVSFALIAAEIGVSRNAVIGKAHRLKLPKRIEISISKRKPVAASKKKPPSIPVSIPAPVVIPQPTIIPGRDYSCTIYELNDGSCRYPLWNTRAPHAERRYCGRPGASFAAGQPYCRQHTTLCAPHPK